MVKIGSFNCCGVGLLAFIILGDLLARRRNVFGMFVVVDGVNVVEVKSTAYIGDFKLSSVVASGTGVTVVDVDFLSSLYKYDKTNADSTIVHLPPL